MKFRLLAMVAVFGLVPSLSHADSVDQFVLSGPSGNGIVYTWTWTLPASFVRDPNNNPPGIFGFSGIDVLTEGPLTGGPADQGVGASTSHDLYFYSTNTFNLSCNSMCSQFISPIFASALWTGTLDNPTFLLGNFNSVDGNTKLSISAVPEGSELAMMGIAALGLLAGFRKSRHFPRPQTKAFTQSA